MSYEINNGEIAEAIATLTLVKNGFEVSLPVFKQPSYVDLKWGRVLHSVQVKSGSLNKNGKTVQWGTTKHSRGLYEEGDCSYISLVLVPHNEIWCIPFEFVRGKRSICTNIERDVLHHYRSAVSNLNKVGDESGDRFSEIVK